MPKPKPSWRQRLTAWVFKLLKPTCGCYLDAVGVVRYCSVHEPKELDKP